MQKCENCGSLIPEDASSCYYCGQKVNIKTHSPTDNKDEMVQPPTNDRDAEEGKNQPLSPTPQTNPASSTKSPNPVLLAVLLIAVISALVLGGVIAANAVRHPSSGMTPSPQITSKPGSQVTPTISPQAKPTTPSVPQVSPTTPTSSGGNPVPITVNVSPNGFNQTSCPQNNDASWTCTATVTETSGLQSVNWSVTSSFSDVAFTSSNGPVSVGNPVTVSIAIPATDCQNSTFIFKFTGGVNSISTSWRCGFVGEPTLGTCSYNVGHGWTCPATLSSNVSNGSNMYWSTSSTGVKGINFGPPNGILLAGKTAQMTISIPDTICPTSATLTFYVGGVLFTNFPWNCSTPTLSVTPTSFYVVDDCSFDQNSSSYVCTVKLSSDSSNQGEMNWSVSSPVSTITFSQPTSDTLLPSGSTMVTITVPLKSCPTNPTLSSSVSGSNPIDVSWTC
jgi:hypothetical protein